MRLPSRLHLSAFLPAIRLLLLVVMGLTLSSGCQREDPEPDTPATPTSDIDPAQDQATRSVWDQGETLLQEALSASDTLHEALEEFLAEPETDTLQGAREAWRRSHNQWHRLDPLLALADSNPGMFMELERLALSIDAHPLQPGYLDYLEDYPYSGIVNDITLNIDADTLRKQHGLTDASDISLGFHALEFLLWGEDGTRPVEDFHTQDAPDATQREAGLTTADLPNNRRRDLTLLLSQLLQDDLEKLRTRWSDRNNNLFTRYHQLQPASRLQLLKNATEQYLNKAALAITEGESSHNVFAGGDLGPLIGGLRSVETLFTQGDPALSKWLGEAQTVEAWLADLDELMVQLQQTSDAGEPINDEQRQEVGEQLEHLAAPFASEDTEISPS